MTLFANCKQLTGSCRYTQWEEEWLDPWIWGPYTRWNDFWAATGYAWTTLRVEDSETSQFVPFWVLQGKIYSLRQCDPTIQLFISNFLSLGFASDITPLHNMRLKWGTFSTCIVVSHANPGFWLSKREWILKQSRLPASWSLVSILTKKYLKLLVPPQWHLDKFGNVITLPERPRITLCTVLDQH